MLRCPEGHASDEADYCSVCGAAMGGVATPVPGVAPPAGSAAGDATCPSCGEPRADRDARYCEVCRFDFVAGKPGPAPVGPGTPPTPTPQPAPAAVAPVARPVAPPPPLPAQPRLWELVVLVDPTLDTDPDPALPCPVGEAERVFPLDLAENLVGRRDDRRDIRPELPVNDPGVSRRHAKFVLSPSGDVSLHDLASTNGSKVNGGDVPAGSRRPLTAGDEVTIGRWTRIRLRERT